MFKKLSDKFSKGIIYLAAFLVTALMAVMMIHIVKESIPAISQLGIKMFLPTLNGSPCQSETAVRTFTCDCRYPLCLSDRSCPRTHLRRCLCLLSGLLPSEKVASIFLAFIDLVAGIPSVIFGFIGLTVLVKAFATHLHMAAGQCILQPGLCWGSCFYHSLFPPVMNLYRLHERLTSSVRSHLDSPENLPCCILFFRQSGRESLQVQ